MSKVKHYENMSRTLSHDPPVTKRMQIGFTMFAKEYSRRLPLHVPLGRSDLLNALIYVTILKDVTHKK